MPLVLLGDELSLSVASVSSVDLLGMGRSTEHVELVGDVDQLAALDLRPAGSGPLAQTAGVERGVAGKRALYRIDDEVQKGGFIRRVAAPHRHHDPVGAAGGEDLRAGCLQMSQQVPPRAAVAGWAARH